jgi:hypothetical protein
MRLRLLLLGGLVATLILPGTAALAAVPTNDTIAGATAIGSIPFSATQDTTQATTDAQDAAVNASCGAPHTDASVWYSYAAASDTQLLVDVSQSNYSAGVIVATGSPGSLTEVTCGPGAIVFSAASGTTYYILAFDDQTDGHSANGGQLVINVKLPPPPPDVTLTVDPIAHFNSKQGTVTVTGTETCTAQDLQFAQLSVNLSQSVGRIGTITGSGYSDLACDGALHHWSVLVFPNSGKFAGGKATVSADGFACNVTTCTDSFVNRTVQLRK